MQIDDLPLTVRAFNCLRLGGFVTVEQIRAATDGELLAIDNLGRKTLREIRDVIREIDGIPAANDMHVEIAAAIRLLQSNGYVVAWPLGYVVAVDTICEPD